MSDPIRTSFAVVSAAVIVTAFDLIACLLLAVVGLVGLIVDDETGRRVFIVLLGCAGALFVGCIAFFFRKNWARTLLAGLHALLTLLWLTAVVMALVKGAPVATLVFLGLAALSAAAAFAFVSVSVRVFCAPRGPGPVIRDS